LIFCGLKNMSSLWNLCPYKDEHEMYHVLVYMISR
jgi:hypothetical protein